MATDLQTTNPSPTRWSEPSLPAALIGPLETAMETSYNFLPVITPDLAEHIPALISHYEAGCGPSTDDQIERMITKIALLYPNSKLSDAESAARLELYIELLRDVPFDVLSKAFRAVAQGNRFFPTVAEIREAAAPELAKRKARMYGLMSLHMKHKREWRAPITDICTPDDARRILAEEAANSPLIKSIASNLNP